MVVERYVRQIGYGNLAIVVNVAVRIPVRVTWLGVIGESDRGKVTYVHGAVMVNVWCPLELAWNGDARAVFAGEGEPGLCSIRRGGCVELVDEVETIACLDDV